MPSNTGTSVSFLPQGGTNPVIPVRYYHYSRSFAATSKYGGPSNGRRIGASNDCTTRTMVDSRYSYSYEDQPPCQASTSASQPPHRHHHQRQQQQQRRQVRRRTLDLYSLRLDEHRRRWVANAGSFARDVCANERTFLSWSRIATTVFLVGVVMCLDFQHIGVKGVGQTQSQVDLVLGCVVMLLSLVALVLAMRRYVLVAGLLATRRQCLPSRGILNWVYLAMASSLVIAIATGLLWRNAD